MQSAQEGHRPAGWDPLPCPRSLEAQACGAGYRRVSVVCVRRATARQTRRAVRRTARRCVTWSAGTCLRYYWYLIDPLLLASTTGEQIWFEMVWSTRSTAWCADTSEALDFSFPGWSLAASRRAFAGAEGRGPLWLPVLPCERPARARSALQSVAVIL